MSVRRLAFISSAVVLGLGATGGSVAMAGADTPPGATSAASTAPTVSSTDGTVTVTLPGVGSLSFAVDPATGAVSSLTVIPVDGSGFAASVPTATAEGVKVVFTSATSTQVLEVSVVLSPSGPVVKAEVDVPDHSTGEPGDDTTPGGPPAVGDEQDGHGDHQGNDEGQSAGQIPSTTVPATAPPTVPTGEDHGNQSNHGSDSGSGSHGSGQPTPAGSAGGAHSTSGSGHGSYHGSGDGSSSGSSHSDH